MAVIMILNYALFHELTNVANGFNNYVYRNGYITLEDYMSFMISRETENIQSLSEVEGAFRAITANGDKPYVTKDEIFQVTEALQVAFKCSK